MSKHFSQIKKGDWPNGLSLPVAKLRLEPRQLSQKMGIRFFEDHDELDSFEAALLRVGRGHEYALIRYDGAPQPGTEVWIREDCPNFAKQMRLFLETLAIPKDWISWLHPELETDGLTAAR